LAGGPYGTPYHAHVKTADGKQLEVLVGKDFKVVDAREHP